MSFEILEKGAVKDSFAFWQSSQGIEVRAAIVRLTRYVAVFEVYNPLLVLRASEVLNDFKIILQDRAVYSGRAVVRNLVSTGLMSVCEITLNESSWVDVEFESAKLGTGKLGEEFQSFMQEWQKLYKVLPEYKIIIADMQSFLSDLQLWLDQLELGIRSTPSGDRLKIENDVAAELSKEIVPCVNQFFERFEKIAEKLDPDILPAHQSYMRRQLHPYVLCAPFAYRTFQKPLGYAGDYEMVNMIVRNGYEGGSLFAKIVNTWFLRQRPAEAHRNRINYLAKKLTDETLRLNAKGLPSRVFNMACGPAQEIQKFLSDSSLCNKTILTLMDFNDETMAYLKGILTEISGRLSRKVSIEYVKKSVQTVLKESGRFIDKTADNQYNMIYCAGLFDYLNDPICKRLMDVMYGWLSPGGLLLATNVEPSNPLRNGMEHLLDWHLVYRTASQMRDIAPTRSKAEDCVVTSDSTGVNVFLEVRKPDNA